jgi:hypothetical protein
MVERRLLRKSRLFFCENHEERRRGRKKDLRKKKAFAFFHMVVL